MSNNLVIAFLGGGNMAHALIDGLCKAGFLPGSIRVSEPDAAKGQQLATQYGVQAMTSNRQAVTGARVVILAVKPGVVSRVLQEVAHTLSPGALVISIAAGINLVALHRDLPDGQPVIRVMPNTPALIGAGISVMLPSPGLDAASITMAETILKAVGEVSIIHDEALMDGVTALSGSGPAYVYLIAEALSDGGVACGLPRDLADRLAAQTLVGSARMILESNLHPGVLKNQVTSPGGTTIAALAELEKAGVRGALITAVQAAWLRSRELGGGK